jgi:hypothetical protein
MNKQFLSSKKIDKLYQVYIIYTRFEGFWKHILTTICPIKGKEPLQTLMKYYEKGGMASMRFHQRLLGLMPPCSVGSEVRLWLSQARDSSHFRVAAIMGSFRRSLVITILPAHSKTI